MRLWRSRRIERQILWLFGSPRTGSTWLLQMLAGHRAVTPINEPLIGLYLGPFLSDWPGTSVSDMDASNFTLSRLARGVQGHFFAEDFEEVWLPRLRSLILARFKAQVGDSPFERRVISVKEPNGSQAADLLLTALPRSRLLFLLRDGRDVVDSDLAAHLPGSWMSRKYPVIRGIDPSERLHFVIQSAHKWLWRTEVVEAAFAAHRGPKRLVRYESLCADPVAEMRGVFDWLELDISEATLSAAVERHAFERAPVHGPQEFHRAGSHGLWRENLTTGEQVAMQGVIGAKLQELGYL